MTRAQRGWLAGIIDGEGSVFARMKGNVAQITVSITNSHPRILETARRYIEEITGYLPKINGPYVRCSYVQISGVEQVRKVLQCVLPDLVGKKEQAVIALDYLKDRPLIPGQRIRAEERARHEKICRQIQSLNKRYSSKRRVVSSVETVREDPVNQGMRQSDLRE